MFVADTNVLVYAAGESACFLEPIDRLVAEP